MDYLPARSATTGRRTGSTPRGARQILWLDGLTDNVDRTWRNPNLLTWHGGPG